MSRSCCLCFFKAVSQVQQTPQFFQQKRCKTCDTGYKLNIKSFECERTFCECENGKPEAQTCDSVNTHKCESCEYSEVNNICAPIYILLT